MVTNGRKGSDVQPGRRQLSSTFLETPVLSSKLSSTFLESLQYFPKNTIEITGSFDLTK